MEQDLLSATLWKSIGVGACSAIADVHDPGCIVLVSHVWIIDFVVMVCNGGDGQVVLNKGSSFVACQDLTPTMTWREQISIVGLKKMRHMVCSGIIGEATGLQREDKVVQP